MSRKTRKRAAKKRANAAKKQTQRASAQAQKPPAAAPQSVPDLNPHIDAVREYRLLPGSVDEGQRSVEAVLATESQVQVFDVRSFQMIDEVLLMSGARVPDQIPLLDTHDRSSVESQQGSTREIRVEGARLVGRNFYSETAERAWKLTREGHLTDNSIGYAIHGYVTVERGTTAEVEGRSFTAPPARDLRVVTDWSPLENSLCPIGADRMAKMRAALTPPQPERKEKGMFEKWLEKRGFAAEDLNEAQEASLRELYEAEQNPVDDDGDDGGEASPAGRREAGRDEPAAPPADPAEAARAAVIEERQRVTAIRKEGLDAQVPDEIVGRCIDDGLDLAAARAEFLKAVRDRAPSVGQDDVPGGEDALEKMDDDTFARSLVNPVETRE